jgi:hypothetical protein
MRPTVRRATVGVATSLALLSVFTATVPVVDLAQQASGNG